MNVGLGKVPFLQPKNPSTMVSLNSSKRALLQNGIMHLGILFCLGKWKCKFYILTFYKPAPIF